MPPSPSKNTKIVAYYSSTKQDWVRCVSKNKLPVISLHILHDLNATYCMGEKRPYMLFWADRGFGNFRHLKSAKTVGKLLYDG